MGEEEPENELGTPMPQRPASSYMVWDLGQNLVPCTELPPGGGILPSAAAAAPDLFWGPSARLWPIMPWQYRADLWRRLY